MKIKNVALIGAAVIPLLSGCAIQPVALNPVGPAPLEPVSSVPTGRLRVFTATETHEIGDNTYFHTHTGYRICTPSGKLVEYVPNHTGYTDESATTVKIPSGNYQVFAQSEAYNLVSIPVVIQGGKLTEVHLDATTWEERLNAPTNELVYLPDGRPVGWSSSMK